jgi:hypothetical protein
MKILITGATGRLGLILVDMLGDKHELRLTGRRPLKTRHEYIPVDLHDIDSFRRLTEGVDAVIHTAAYLNDKVAGTPKEIFDVNVFASISLMDAAVKNGVKKFIYGSSMASRVGGKRKDYYSLGKYMCDAACKFFYTRYGISMVSIRYWGFTEVATPVLWLIDRYFIYGVDVRDQADFTVRVLENDKIVCDVLDADREFPFTPEDIQLGLTDPVAAISKYYPGYKDLILKYKIKMYPEPVLGEFEKAKRITGHRTKYGLDYLFKELRRLDEAGEMEDLRATISENKNNLGLS